MIRRTAPIRRFPFKKGKPKRSTKRLPREEYQALCSEVFERDGGRCRRPGCDTRWAVHAHHIIFRSQGGEDKRGNLITLCAACHTEIHNRKLWIVGMANNAQFTTINPKRSAA